MFTKRKYPVLVLEDGDTIELKSHCKSGVFAINHLWTRVHDNSFLGNCYWINIGREYVDLAGWPWFYTHVFSVMDSLSSREHLVKNQLWRSLTLHVLHACITVLNFWRMTYTLWSFLRALILWTYWSLHFSQNRRILDFKIKHYRTSRKLVYYEVKEVYYC